MSDDIAELRAMIERQRLEIDAIKATMLNTVDGLASMLEMTGIISRRDLAKSISANTAERRCMMSPDDAKEKAELDMIESAAMRLLSPSQAKVTILGTTDGRLQ